MEWKEDIAADFCSSVTDGTHDSPKATINGKKLITSKHLKDGYIDFESAKFISEKDYLKVIERSKVDQFDILFSMIGTIGNIYRETSPNIEYAVKNMGIFKMGGNAIRSKWLYYWLKSKEAHAYIYERMAGSTQSYLTLDSLRKFPVVYPEDINDMENIVSILSSLDRKIELNNKINADLEEMAQAIFKNWFVDFEPFKDGKFVDSELGMIPEGWKVSQIADIPHILETGKRPKGGAVEKGIPSVGAEHVKGMCAYDYSKTKYINCEFAAKLKTGKINGYELMIYKDGGKPGYFIPNFSIFGEGYPFENCYLNEHVFKLDFDGNKEFNIFCYFFFKTEQIMSYFNAQGAKAAIPGINKKDVENIYIFSPDNESVIKFGEFAYPLFKQMLKNAIENRTLSLLRDTLLPRLMSGEIEVPE